MDYENKEKKIKKQKNKNTHRLKILLNDISVYIICTVLMFILVVKNASPSTLVIDIAVFIIHAVIMVFLVVKKQDSKSINVFMQLKTQTLIV